MQAMRRKVPDSGKCANGVQKVSFSGTWSPQRAISKADVAISAGAASRRLGDIEGLPAPAQLPCGLLPEMLRLVFAPHTGAVSQIDVGAEGVRAVEREPLFTQPCGVLVAGTLAVVIVTFIRPACPYAVLAKGKRVGMAGQAGSPGPRSSPPQQELPNIAVCPAKRLINGGCGTGVLLQRAQLIQAFHRFYGGVELLRRLLPVPEDECPVLIQLRQRPVQGGLRLFPR